MHKSESKEEAIISRAIAVLKKGEDNLFVALEELPAPLYVTDASGLITYFNSACINFAGRTPVVGQDRWCVTWKLYTDDGEFLPHDCCPMAEAIQQKRPVRGAIAAAERPDGTRVYFAPYPTPVFNADGSLRGAVNILIDITDQRQAASFRAQAERCRRIARTISDRTTIDTLIVLASEYEQKATALDRLH